MISCEPGSYFGIFPPFQLYEICSGKLLCSFLFDMALTCVVMDKAEQLAFVGGMSGKISQVNLFLQVHLL